jgi:formylglycine-generating enzyme required for sulfatase activity
MTTGAMAWLCLAVVGCNYIAGLDGNREGQPRSGAVTGGSHQTTTNSGGVFTATGGTLPVAPTTQSIPRGGTLGTTLDQASGGLATGGELTLVGDSTGGVQGSGGQVSIGGSSSASWGTQIAVTEGGTGAGGTSSTEGGTRGTGGSSAEGGTFGISSSSATGGSTSNSSGGSSGSGGTTAIESTGGSGSGGLLGVGGETSHDAGAAPIDAATLDDASPDAQTWDFDGFIAQAPTSCVPTLALCGSADPCVTQRVAGGSFPMGRSDSGNDAFVGGSADEQPEHDVRVSTFWLDEFEVTVGRFRRFVDSYAGIMPTPGSGAFPGVVSSGWQEAWNVHLPQTNADLRAALIANDPDCNAQYRTWTQTAGNNECLPINCIDWHLAYAFCVWDGGRLPTEAEWEYAAAGGDENRLYPWGPDAPDKTRAVFNCIASGSLSCTPSDIRPIGGTLAGGLGRFGQADLAGSMLEPTRDVADRNFYSTTLAIGTNVINLVGDGVDSIGTRFTAHGGNYLNTAALARATSKTYITRTSHFDGVGMRCARAVQ